MTTTVELLGWSVGMDAWGFETLLIWSALMGFSTTLVGTVRSSYHWLGTGVAALVGGWLGSEVVASEWGTVVEGLTLLPALIGGIAFALAVDFFARRTNGGSYGRRSRGALRGGARRPDGSLRDDSRP